MTDRTWNWNAPRGTGFRCFLVIRVYSWMNITLSCPLLVLQHLSIPSSPTCNKPPPVPDEAVHLSLTWIILDRGIVESHFNKIGSPPLVSYPGYPSTLPGTLEIAKSSRKMLRPTDQATSLPSKSACIAITLFQTREELVHLTWIPSQTYHKHQSISLPSVRRASVLHGWRGTFRKSSSQNLNSACLIVAQKSSRPHGEEHWSGFQKDRVVCQAIRSQIRFMQCLFWCESNVFWRKHSLLILKQ